MAKTKSPRTPVRKSPQPKVHQYIPVVFVDDYGRDRALTVSSAKQFSRKKLDASSRSLLLRGSSAMDRAIAASDRETARAVRRLRRQERETDRAIKRFFRRVIKTKVPIAKVKFKKPKKLRMILPSAWHTMPKYDGPIRDKLGRRGVFARFRYYSSRTAKPGVSKRVTIYIIKGAALDADGERMFRTNVGLTIEEAVAGFDHVEQVNWSAQKGAKILNHAILAMDYRWTPEEMLEVAERWAEERFGQYDLPYCVALHEPPPEGDVRNWHSHVTWSWRPLERIGDHKWLVGEALRSDLDGAQGMLVLRERFAAQMTEMSLRTGNRDIYTALSNVARGMPHEPQIHLGEARTRNVRDGGFDAGNEENHERVLRSKAAIIDDDLRREGERLAQRQRIEQRVKERFAKVITVPAVPSMAIIASRISGHFRAMKVQVLRMAKSLDLPISDIAPVPRPAANPSLAHWCRDWIEHVRPQVAKIANLRFSQITPFRLPEVPEASRSPTKLQVTQTPAKLLRPAKISKIVPAPASYAPGQFAVPDKVSPRPVMAQVPVPAPPTAFAVRSLKIANLLIQPLPPAAAPAVVPTVPEPLSTPHLGFVAPAAVVIPRMAKPVLNVPKAPAEYKTSLHLGIVSVPNLKLADQSTVLPLPAVPPVTSKPVSIDYRAVRVEIAPFIARELSALIDERIARALIVLADSKPNVDHGANHVLDRRASDPVASQSRLRAEKRQSPPEAAAVEGKEARRAPEPTSKVPKTDTRHLSGEDQEGGRPRGLTKPGAPSGESGDHNPPMSDRKFEDVSRRAVHSGTRANADADAEEAERQAKKAEAARKRQAANAKSHALLLATLMSGRHLVKAGKSRLTVPPEVLAKLEMTDEQIGGEAVQRALGLLRYDQQAEIASLMAHVTRRPDRLKKVGGQWTFQPGGPTTLRSSTTELVEAWSENADVRKAFAELATLGPPSDALELDRRRRRFGQTVYTVAGSKPGEREAVKAINQKATGKRFPWPTDNGIA